MTAKGRRFLEWLSQQPCAVTGQFGVEVAHRNAVQNGDWCYNENVQAVLVTPLDAATTRKGSDRVEESTPPSKTCSACGEDKPLTGFYRNKACADGREGTCKECRKAGSRRYYATNRETVKTRVREYERENPEKAREWSRRADATYRRKHHARVLDRLRKWKVANREHVRAYKREYYQRPEGRAQASRYRANNQEKVRAWARQSYRRRRPAKASYDRNYYSENRETILERNRRYARENPGIISRSARVSRARRRARLRRVGGSHTTADILAQFRAQKGKCWWCRKSVGNRYHVDHLIPLAQGGSNGPGNIVIACPSCNLSRGAKLPHEHLGRLL